MVGILKRSREEMEAGTKGTLQNPEHQDVEGPRKKQMLDAPNGTSVSRATDSAYSDSNSNINSNSNGTCANGGHRDVATTNGSVQNPLEEDIDDAPPPLPKTEGWIPFDKVVARSAQEVQNALLEVLESLSGPPPASVTIESGEGPRKRPVTYDSQFLRRKQLWDFAIKHRNKLIKLLVLSQWCRNSKAVSGLIDIKVYLDKQKAFYREAVGWVGELKRFMDHHRALRPDLELALEVLSTQKAGWISDLGYIPKKPLSAQEMLDSMREINAILIARLSLHDVVPDVLQDYIVRDGRATFKVKDEFEIALGIGSDKHEDQLFFVDFRFCFSPGDEPLPDAMTQHLAMRVNNILLKDGLQGCYDFLHNFTLTHKLNILRAQAAKLTRSRWGDSIKVEPIHRSLILQYWTDRPGRKSWIEIGIRRRRTKEELLDVGVVDTPHLSLRWHRQGKEVLKHGLDIDTSDLSLEAILKDTVAAHTNYILSRTKIGLRAQQTASLFYTVKHHASPIEPTDCALDIMFPDGQQVTLKQEPISGRFEVLPPSEEYEKAMNKSTDPAVMLVEQLKKLRAAEASWRHSRTIAMEGWTATELPLHKDVVDEYLGLEVYKLRCYQPPSTWNESWVLCLSHRLSGEDIWHLIQLRPKGTWRDRVAVRKFVEADVNPIARAFKISTVPRRDTSAEHVSSGVEKSRLSPHQFLHWILCQAAALSSRVADIRWLQSTNTTGGKRFDLAPISENVASLARRALKDGVTLPFAPVSAPQLRLDLAANSNPATVTCYNRAAVSIIDGIYHEGGKVLTNTIARLGQALPIADKFLAFDQGSIHISATDSRTLSIRLQTPIGMPSISVLQDRLAGFARIATCVNDLCKMGLTVETFDLKRITASLKPLILDKVKSKKHWSDKQYHVYFSCDENGPTGVTFDPSGPYYSLRSHFNDYLQSSNGRFHMFVRELCGIAPAIFALTEQHQEHIIGPFLAFRDPRELRVSWGIRGSMTIGYIMQYGRADGEPCWRLALFKSRDTDVPEPVQKVEEAWAKMCTTKGDGFEGMRTELKVDFDAASTALWHILDTFSPHLKAWHESLKPASESSIKTESTANGTTQQQQPQARGKDKDKPPAEKRKESVVKKEGPNRQVITLD